SNRRETLISQPPTPGGSFVVFSVGGGPKLTPVIPRRPFRSPLSPLSTGAHSDRILQCNRKMDRRSCLHGRVLRVSNLGRIDRKAAAYGILQGQRDTAFRQRL